MLQMDFLTEFFKKAKAEGVHTTLDTSGNPFTDQEPWHSGWLELMKYTDLVMLDIKQIDEQEHIKLTGHSNKNILAMARELSDMKKPVWIRHVLVPGGSDKDEYLHRLADFIHTLSNVERVEVLPYHTLGKFKWENLGLSYPLEGVNPPTQESPSFSQVQALFLRAVHPPAFPALSSPLIQPELPPSQVQEYSQ